MPGDDTRQEKGISISFLPEPHSKFGPIAFRISAAHYLLKLSLAILTKVYPNS